MSLRLQPTPCRPTEVAASPRGAKVVRGWWRIASIVLSLTLLLGLGAQLAAPARAQVSIGVGPSLVELAAKPGATGEQPIAVTNGGSAPIELTVAVEPYRGVTGDASAVDWLTADPPSLRLEPGEQRTVTVRIAIPRGLPSGGRYAMVTVTTGGQTTAGQAGTAIAGKLGVPFLIAVDGKGELTREVSVDHFAPVLEPDGRVGFLALLRNEGNLHVVAEGAIEVSRSDGSPLGRLELPQTMAILPGRDQLLSAYGSLPLAADATFAATATIEYGAEQPATAEVAFGMRPALDIVALGVCENLDRGPTLRLTLRNEGDLGLLPQARLMVRAAGGQEHGAVSPPPVLLWPGETGDVVVDLPERLLTGDYVLAVRIDYAAPTADGQTALSPLEQELSFRIGGLDEGAATLCPATPATEEVP